MHKYLLKIGGLLLFSSCLLWGILSAAYVSIENYQKLSGCSSVLGNTDQKPTLQEEGTHQPPFASLGSSFDGLFSEPDHKRSSKDNPTHIFLHTAQHPAGSSAYALYLIKPVKALYYTKSTSIYLLDCAFLI